MMLTAINGCLIVAMLFAWGMWANKPAVMAVALGAALASWVINVFSDLDAFDAWRKPIAVAAYAVAAVVAVVALPLIVKAVI